MIACYITVSQRGDLLHYDVDDTSGNHNYLHDLLSFEVLLCLLRSECSFLNGFLRCVGIKVECETSLTVERHAERLA